MAKRAKRSGKRNASGVRGHYVPSTHWDREWYEPFQHYRFRLVKLIDDLLDLMERDPDYAYFHLDGQAILLEDYLEIRPENEERLQALFDAGRLEAGPWYVLPDEFLPCGESLVRNLLRGHQLAESFGPTMKVGFASDLFGHISQLPQLFHGFDIDTAIVWRGTNYPKHKGVFRWQAPDGSETLTYAFVREGYCQYMFNVRTPAERPDGTLDVDKALAGLQHLFEVEPQRVPGQAFMLYDGFDHADAEPATTELHRRAREAGLDIRTSTWQEFFADVRSQKLRLDLFKGELRDPGVADGQHLIPGVLSSRIRLKQANAHCESLLLQWCEPFAAYAHALGQPYPATYLDLAWQYLLQNHPHDSICGCSIDQVHRDMEHRFDQCRLIAERQRQVSLRHIADQTKLPKLVGDEDFALTVFNPTQSEIDGVVELPLRFDRRTENRFQEWFGYEKIIGFRLFDERGREQAYQRLDVTKLKPHKEFSPVGGYRGGKYEQVRIAAPLKIPALGWTTLRCAPTKERTRSTGSQLVNDRTMENKHLRVTINPNGTIDLTHRKSRRTFSQLLTFEERADIGDGWFHGTAVNDEIFTSVASAADVALIHDGFAQTTFRIRLAMNAPARFEFDEKIMRRSATLTPLVITSWVTLKADADWVEVLTEIDNTACDHRVRVLLPTEIKTNTYFADGAFDVLERSIALDPQSHAYMEPEVETKPQASWTAVNNGKLGLAVVSQGQPESAVRDMPDRPIALTLLRGFQRTVAEEGEMGGQSLGRQQHRYWIFPHAGELPTQRLFALGQRLAGGVETVQTDAKRLPRLPKKPTLPPTGCWLKLGPGPLVLTACKLSEDEQALLVRLFNSGDAPARQTLESAAKLSTAHTANMLEEPLEKLPLRNGRVTVAAKPREIVTLRLSLK